MDVASWHFSAAGGLTDDVGSWGKADSQPTSWKRRECPIRDIGLIRLLSGFLTYVKMLFEFSSIATSNRRN
jgi:hypothetical protein